MRGINFDGSRGALLRIEQGMRNLAEAIHELLERGKVAGDLASSLAESPPPQRPGAPGSMRATAPRANPGPAPRLPSAATAAPQPVAPQPSAPQQPSRPMPSRPAPMSTATATALRSAPPRPATEGLKGTSQSMPLLSVFQFLGRMRKAGTMRVSLGNENLTFELQNGCLLATTSTQCPREELLGELLVAGGACSPGKLDPIVVRVGTGSNERFGQSAIEAGIVTEAQVLAALERQAHARYTRACKHADAKYEFVEGLRGHAASRFATPPIPVA
jgi:hypothetical protein